MSLKKFHQIQLSCTLSQRSRIASSLASLRQPNDTLCTNKTKNKLAELEKNGYIYGRLDSNSEPPLTKYANIVIDYFKTALGYTAHVPIYSTSRETYLNRGVSTKYLSYDTQTVLNCPAFFPIIEEVSQALEINLYLECRPFLYSCNTFWTFPASTQLLTHNYHRDLDDFRFLSVFIFWTKATEKSGYISYISGSHTHRDHKYILDKHKKRIISLSCNSSYKRYPSEDILDIFYRLNMGVPNGYGFDSLYSSLFHEYETKLYGLPGQMFIADTFGLHRGSSVCEPRLVTWLRFGLYPNLAYIMDSNKIPFRDSQPPMRNMVDNIPQIDFSLLADLHSD